LKYCGTAGKPGGKLRKQKLNLKHWKKPVYSTKARGKNPGKAYIGYVVEDFDR
jgi:hypothetical protein